MKEGSNDCMDKKRSMWARVNEIDHPTPYQMCGERQLLAGSAAITAVAGTGLLEIGVPVGLWTKQISLIYHQLSSRKELCSDFNQLYL